MEDIVTFRSIASRVFNSALAVNISAAFKRWSLSTDSLSILRRSFDASFYCSCICSAYQNLASISFAVVGYLLTPLMGVWGKTAFWQPLLRGIFQLDVLRLCRITL